MGFSIPCSCFTRTLGGSQRLAVSRQRIHAGAASLLPFRLSEKSHNLSRKKFSSTGPNVFVNRKRKFSRSDLHAPWTVCSWGQDVEFVPVKVEKTESVTEQLHRLLINVGQLASGYTTPGQFLQLKVEDSKPAFIAIASPPSGSSQSIELLVKNQGEAAQKLCSVKEGSEILASPVMGKGFAVDKIPVEDVSTVFLFATGTGISPIKALIESGDLQADKRRGAVLYYGATNKSTMAYVDLLPQWETLGVKVIPVYSDDGLGYVQDIFDKENLLKSPESTGVVLCGQREMCEAVTEVMTGAGVDSKKILLNF